MASPPRPRTFSYTAHKSAYWTLTGSFCFLFILEGGLVALIVALLVHIRWLALLLDGLHTVLCLSLLGLLLAPLWTKHTLTSQGLHVRHGVMLNVLVPLTAIAKVEPFVSRATNMPGSGARYDAKLHRISAIFSSYDLVLITLNATIPLKVGRREQPTDSLLLNVDQRASFIAALSALMTISKSAGSIEQAMKPLNGSPAPASDLPREPAQRIEQDELAPSPTAHVLVEASAAVPDLAIRIEGLTYAYHEDVAVDHLTMHVARGEIYGFLGSNGAGKTTTIKMLVGLLRPASGRAWIAGHDVWDEPLAAKAACGYVADRSLLYERLTGREFLTFLAQMRDLPRSIFTKRITHLLDLMDLTQQADQLCGTYSFGMKRKLALVGALLPEPQVLILDEPLNGLDPRTTHRLKDLLRSLAEQGHTILLSTHDLATAEMVCHRVGIFHKGRLLAEGSAAELRQRATAPDLETVFLNLTAAPAVEQEAIR